MLFEELANSRLQSGADPKLVSLGGGGGVGANVERPSPPHHPHSSPPSLPPSLPFPLPLLPSIPLPSLEEGSPAPENFEILDCCR